MGQCVPNYKQRVRLQELSTKIWGSSGRWQKAMAQINIPTATLDEAATSDGDQPKFKMGQRHPSFDEMIEIMDNELSKRSIEKLSKEERLISLAQQFVAQTLKVRLAFPLKEDDLPEAEDLYALLDKDVADRVKPLVVGDQDVIPGVFMIPAIEFLTELAYLKDPSLREADQPATQEVQA